MANWSELSLVNPEEVGDYAQGDILMPPQQGRNGVREEVLRWPQGHIPYRIDGYFSTYYKLQDIVLTYDTLPIVGSD